MSESKARSLLSQDEMIHICADIGRDAIITVIAPYLIHRQAVARKLLHYYGNEQMRTGLIEMLNYYNKEIAKLMGLAPPDTLY